MTYHVRHRLIHSAAFGLEYSRPEAQSDGRLAMTPLCNGRRFFPEPGIRFFAAVLSNNSRWGNLNKNEGLHRMGFLTNTCAICSGPITPQTPVIGTSGCAFPESHHLWQYCDTQLHQECLVDWPYRSEFSTGYFGIRSGGHVLQETKEWRLCCGPVQYGPHGKVSLPYYAEIRLREWPVRLYSRFQEWDDFISSRKWQATSISALSCAIEKLLPIFPVSSSELEELLLPRIIEMLEFGVEHRTRYVAVLALHLFREKAIIAEPVVRLALNDEHGSVRQAAHMLLKSLNSDDAARKIYPYI